MPFSPSHPVLCLILHKDGAVRIALRHLRLALFQAVEHVMGQDDGLQLAPCRVRCRDILGSTIRQVAAGIATWGHNHFHGGLLLGYSNGYRYNATNLANRRPKYLCLLKMFRPAILLYHPSKSNGPFASPSKYYRPIPSGFEHFIKSRNHLFNQLLASHMP